MEEETSQSQAPADPAALAFEALREEVALVRRAVTGLAAERAAIEIPDYSETLGQIVRASEATAASLKTLAAMPALRLTAHDWAHEIAAASEQARRADQEALTQARDALQQAARDMTAKLTSAKSADKPAPMAFVDMDRRILRRNAPLSHRHWSGGPRHAGKLALAGEYGGRHCRDGSGGCRRPPH